MAAETETSTTAGNQDSDQFLEELRCSEIKQRQRCELMQVNSSRKATNHNCGELHRKVLQVMASSSRLEQKLNDCLWAQEVFIILVTGLMALWSFTLYAYFSSGYVHWITAKN